MDPIRLHGKDRYEWERALTSRHTRSRQLVLRVLLDAAGGKAECWPSNRKIADTIGIKPRAVQLILRALEAAGAIRCINDDSLTVQRRIVLLGHPGTLAAMRLRGGANNCAGSANSCAKGRRGAAVHGAQSSSPELVQKENEKESASSVRSGDSRPADADDGCYPGTRRFFGHLPELKSEKNSR